MRSGVWCTSMITLPFLTFELLLLAAFHLLNFDPEQNSISTSGISLKLEIRSMDNSYWGVQCIRMITLPFLIFELLPFVAFPNSLIFCPEQNSINTWSNNLKLKIRSMDRSYWRVQCTRMITLLFKIFELLPFVIFHA